MNSSEGLRIEEIVRETGISERNIKYWTMLYELDVTRMGRSNFYPASTVKMLEAIHRLAEFGFFSTEYIRWLVDLALKRPVKNAALTRRYAAEHRLLSRILDLPLPDPRGVSHGESADLSRPAVSRTAASGESPGMVRGRVDSGANSGAPAPAGIRTREKSPAGSDEVSRKASSRSAESSSRKGSGLKIVTRRGPIGDSSFF